MAYAADTGETMAPKDSRIVFTTGTKIGMMGLMRDDAFFSGQLFKVTGENIQTVSASIDKADLYRMRSFAISEEEVNAFFDGTDPRAKDSDAVHAGSPDGKQTYAEVLWKLENGFVDAYDPDTCYGILGTAQEMSEDVDPQDMWHDSIDHSTARPDRHRHLHRRHDRHPDHDPAHGQAGLRICDGEIGPQLTGEVLTDAEADAQGYVYGVYAD